MIRRDTGVRARAPTRARERRTARRPPPLLRLLLLLAAPLPACVIPLAPEFQDPPATENFPPKIVSANPEVGKIVTGAPPFDFTVTVTDPNDGDAIHPLYLRWVSDFPPFIAGVTNVLSNRYTVVTLPAPGGQYLLQERFTCQPLSPELAQHRLTVILADRAFDLTVEDDPEALVSAGGIDTASWTLAVQCP